MTEAADKPRSVNMTIKLERSAHDRLTSLAVIKHLSAADLMEEAVQFYLDKEERDQRFIAAAKQSRQHYQETGLHISHDEFSQWVDELQRNPRATPPACHT